MYIFILRLLLGRCVSNGPFSRAQLLKKGEKKIKRFLFFHARNDIVAFQKEEEEKQGSNSTNDAGKKNCLKALRNSLQSKEYANSIHSCNSCRLCVFFFFPKTKKIARHFCLYF
jgi:hypothetical protein